MKEGMEEAPERRENEGEKPQQEDAEVRESGGEQLVRDLTNEVSSARNAIAGTERKLNQVRASAERLTDPSSRADISARRSRLAKSSLWLRRRTVTALAAVLVSLDGGSAASTDQGSAATVTKVPERDRRGPSRSMRPKDEGPPRRSRPPKAKVELTPEEHERMLKEITDAMIWAKFEPVDPGEAQPVDEVDLGSPDPLGETVSRRQTVTEVELRSQEAFEVDQAAKELMQKIVADPGFAESLSRDDWKENLEKKGRDLAREMGLPDQEWNAQNTLVALANAEVQKLAEKKDPSPQEAALVKRFFADPFAEDPEVAAARKAQPEAEQEEGAHKAEVVDEKDVWGDYDKYEKDKP